MLTDIDVSATLKAKLGEDFRPYRILGRATRNSRIAPCSSRTRSAPCFPVMSLCNSTPTARRRFSAVDPVASMQAIENPRLAEVAKEVRAKLRHVVNAL